MSHTTSGAWNSKNCLRVVYRYGRRGATVFLGVIALAIIGLVLCPREYMSEAKLLVRLGRENVSLDPTATTGQVVGMNSSREVEMNSIIEALRSRAIAEKVLDIVKTPTPANTPLKRERALRKLIKDTTVMSDHLDESLNNAVEIETRLQLPVLISIPQVNGKPANHDKGGPVYV